MEEFSHRHIEKIIYSIRGQKVMIDSDLAALYGVELKHFNRQVRRNLERFPADFMFQLDADEYRVLRPQLIPHSPGRGGKQKLPLVFTENGVAMLSGVLHSPRAIKVNIVIMRIFTRMKSFLLLEQELRSDLSQMKADTSKMFKIVFERLDSLEEAESEKPKRKKIGLK